MSMITSIQVLVPLACASICIILLAKFFVLTVLTTTSTTMFPAVTYPKTSRLIQIHRNLRNGWDLLWNTPRKSAPHIGGTNENGHDPISALSIFPNETLVPEVYKNRALNHDSLFSSVHSTNPPHRSVY
eukprot:scaffold88416_cov36-Attheya_sp.AAC.3